jgi:hypothetical protein
MKEEDGTGNHYKISHHQTNRCLDTILTVNCHVPHANNDKRHLTVEPSALRQTQKTCGPKVLLAVNKSEQNIARQRERERETEKLCDFKLEIVSRCQVYSFR